MLSDPGEVFWIIGICELRGHDPYIFSLIEVDILHDVVPGIKNLLAPGHDDTRITGLSGMPFPYKKSTLRDKCIRNKFTGRQGLVICRANSQPDVQLAYRKNQRSVFFLDLAGHTQYNNSILCLL